MYEITPTDQAPAMNGTDACPIWESANTLQIDKFLKRSSVHHRPETTVRMLYETRAIYIWFQVDDRFVRSVRTQYQGNVCRDSCVEFFTQPKPGLGYFNLEINAGGTILIFYCTFQDGKRHMEHIPWELGRTIQVAGTLPPVVDPESTTPVEWWIRARVPTAVFEPYIGPLGPLKGQTWKANFYKCASDLSHPHWASWQPLEEHMNFHVPEVFGDIHFA